MEGLGWFAAIIVGGIAGWIAQKIMKTDHGLVLNIFMGISGALVANAIFMMLLGSTLGGWFGQLVVGVIGACALIALFRTIQGRR